MLDGSTVGFLGGIGRAVQLFEALDVAVVLIPFFQLVSLR